MTFDPLFLSRLQWAWVIGWHILLPAFTVGMASYIAVLEGLYFFRKDEIWLRMSRFWTRIFAVAFGMGVVTGIVMPFQFGTNWSRFSDATANVLSPMLAYEDLMAFFLEASFLGVLLFGRRLVPRWAYFLSACTVALGTLMSSFWILAANSWMQTPAGYTVRDGRFFPADWTAIVFNPSFPYRLAHNVTAFYVTTGFVVLGVGATLVRRSVSVAEAQRMMTMALGFLAIFVPLQIFLGDLQGLNTRQYQPAKLAAIEGRWQTAAPAPLTLFGIPDPAQQRMDDAIEVPYLGSLILTHSLDGTVQGLSDFPADQRPPVWPVFFAFRLMVAIGFMMLGIVALGWWLRRQRTAVRDRLVPAPLPVRGAAWVSRRALRLDGDRGRPPTLDGLWRSAHGEFGLALADRLRRRVVAARLHGDLSDDVSGWICGDGSGWCGMAAPRPRCRSPRSPVCSRRRHSQPRRSNENGRRISGHRADLDRDHRARRVFVRPAGRL